MTDDRPDRLCPACGSQGSRIQYGLPAGPPGPGVVLGGCIISPDNPDFLCETCRASWRVSPDGRVSIVDPGTPASSH